MGFEVMKATGTCDLSNRVQST